MTKETYLSIQKKFWEVNSGSLGELKKEDFLKLSEKLYDDNSVLFGAEKPAPYVPAKETPFVKEK